METFRENVAMIRPEREPERKFAWRSSEVARDNGGRDYLEWGANTLQRASGPREREMTRRAFQTNCGRSG